MRKRLVLAMVFFILSGLSFLGFRFLQTREQFSALQVTATPKSQVFLNGQSLGETSLFNDRLKSGEYTLKLIPSQTGLVPFEQKIKLSPLLLTAIDRTFKETDSQSEGSILTLEPISDKNASEVIVISTPSEAKVLLDNQLKGVTPLEIKDVTASDHEIELNSPGFADKKIRIKTSAGYKLVANVKLGVGEESKEASPSPTIPPAGGLTPTPVTPSVKIKQTPTGFLRVRFSPSLSATEVARVKPGETFPVLEEQPDWTKISLPGNLSGWVSNLYITGLNP